jgi:hypothetical protein
MNLLNFFKKILFGETNTKYVNHPEAVIIACYYNPEKNPYRLIAFNKFYESIKHLNHRIVECVIGDAKPELNHDNINFSLVHTQTTLWHKETLLNGLVKKLPYSFKYVMWVDADVLFTNKNWLVDAVKELQKKRIVQLFEYCVHLEQDQYEPDFNLHEAKDLMNCEPPVRHLRLWRSFAANYVTTNYSDDHNYDKHGHVGFAWGAQRSLLKEMPLYDKALVGGADHIIAHAAAGHICHNCITKSFTEDIDAVNKWSKKFFKKTKGKLGFVKGDLYHIWHGALENRQYLKRIKEFTPIAKNISEKDKNGLYITEDDAYVKNYFKHRENTGQTTTTNVSVDNDNSFVESAIIGYMTDSAAIGTLVGGNLIGGIIGESMNNNNESFEGGFGGGDFSGSGAGGSFENDNENFS